MADEQNTNIVVSDFELQASYYVHFQINLLILPVRLLGW